MKIIINEAQYDGLSKEQLKKFLFKFWDDQKASGVEPSLDPIIYNISGIMKSTSDDYTIIRPLWYEYHGGIKEVIQNIKDLILHGEFEVKEESGDLDIIIFIEDVYTGHFTTWKNTIDITFHIIGGTIDGYRLNDDGVEIPIGNIDIFDQYREMEYDTQDLDSYIEEAVWDYLKKIIGKYEVRYTVAKF